MPDELGHPSQVLGPVEAAHVSWDLPPNDKLEIGAGVSLFFPGGVAIPIALGYRYAPISTGVSLRVAVTPFVFLPTTGQRQSAVFWPWAGLSLGHNFEATMRPPPRPGFQRLRIPRPSLPKLTPSASWKTIGVLPEESGFKTI